MSVDERLVAKRMAKALAFLCLDEHLKQPLHNGKKPLSKTGDYTDVFITDAEGRRIIWCQACRVSALEKTRMVEDVVTGIYDFLLNVETEGYARRLEEAYKASKDWNEPRLSGKRRQIKQK